MTEIAGYAQGGCFLETIPATPLTDGLALTCREFTWTVTNTTEQPLASIMVSDDFGAILDRLSTAEMAAVVVGLRVTDAAGMRGEAFDGKIFSAAADVIPAGNTVALRIRIEILHPKDPVQSTLEE